MGTNATPSPGPDNKSKPSDDSLNHAKSFGVDFSKSFCNGFWDRWWKKDQPLSKSISGAFSSACDETAKSVVEELQKDADPMSPNRYLLQLWGKDYYSPMRSDIYDQLNSKSQQDLQSMFGIDLKGMNAKDANSRTFTSSDGLGTDGEKDAKGKGFDWHIGFPRGGAKLTGSITDLATHGFRPTTLKEISVGESGYVKYSIDGAQVKLSLKTDGAQGLKHIRNWADITSKELKEQGSASVSGNLSIGIEPKKLADSISEAFDSDSKPISPSDAPSHQLLDRVHITLNTGFQWSSQVSADGSRGEKLDGYVNGSVEFGWEPDYSGKNKWIEEHKDK